MIDTNNGIYLCTMQYIYTIHIIGIFFVYVCDLFTFDMYIICIILYYLLNVLLLYALKHLFTETTLNYSDGL